MVLEELKLMESEAGATNQIIQGVVEIVATIMEEESRKMTAVEVYAFKILSMIA